MVEWKLQYHDVRSKVLQVHECCSDHLSYHPNPLSCLQKAVTMASGIPIFLIGRSAEKGKVVVDMLKPEYDGTRSLLFSTCVISPSTYLF